MMSRISIIWPSSALLVLMSVLAITTTQAVYAQTNQAPNSDRAPDTGQGPPVTQGWCIVMDIQTDEICKQYEVFNPGECMQKLREAEEAGEPSPFGSAIDTDEECKAAFPYTAPYSQNPND